MYRGQHKIEKSTRLGAVERSCVRAVTSWTREQQQQQQQQEQQQQQQQQQQEDHVRFNLIWINLCLAKSGWWKDPLPGSLEDHHNQSGLKKISKFSTTKAQYPTVSLTLKWHLQGLLVLRQPAISFKFYYSKKVKNPFYISHLSFLQKNTIIIRGTSEVRGSVWLLFQDFKHRNRAETEPPSRLLTSSTTSKLLEPNCFQPSTRRTCMCSQRRVCSFWNQKLSKSFREDMSLRDAWTAFWPSWFIQVEAWCFHF